MRDWSNKLDFNKLYRLQSQYSQIASKIEKNFINDLNSEALDKLWQLKFLVKEIMKLERKEKLFFKLTFRIVTITKKKLPRFLLKISLKRGKWLHIYSEAFYYFAWRLILIYKKLPGIKMNIEGVTIVRNVLLEHPEKNTGIYIRSFGFLGKDGPVIKAARYENQKDIHKDKGLYKNAEELLTKAEKTLRDYINKNTSAQKIHP